MIACNAGTGSVSRLLAAELNIPVKAALGRVFVIEGRALVAGAGGRPLPFGQGWLTFFGP